MSVSNQKPFAVIVRDFEFSRDFRSIQWKATLKYNLLRAAMTGCVIALIGFNVPALSVDNRFLVILVPFLWPVFYIFFVIPSSVLMYWFSEIPFVGLFSRFLSLISVTLGDPFVCIISHYYPNVVPVEAPPLFSLTPVFWVIDAPEISVAS